MRGSLRCNKNPFIYGPRLSRQTISLSAKAFASLGLKGKVNFKGLGRKAVKAEKVLPGERGGFHLHSAFCDLKRRAAVWTSSL